MGAPLTIVAAPRRPASVTLHLLSVLDQSDRRRTADRNKHNQYKKNNSRHYQSQSSFSSGLSSMDDATMTKFARS
jgi:hypothetical protein